MKSIEIAAFTANFETRGTIELTVGTCHVCQAENVPVVAIDSSGDEYGPGCICEPCCAKVRQMLSEFRLPPNGQETAEASEQEKLWVEHGVTKVPIPTSAGIGDLQHRIANMVVRDLKTSDWMRAVDERILELLERVAALEARPDQEAPG